MHGSRRLAVIGVVALVGLGATAGSAAATVPTTDSEAGCSSASWYVYDPITRVRLITRRSEFDPTDGLQRWERLLLAMDPNGAANAGR
jgi:hypothetical protein